MHSVTITSDRLLSTAVVFRRQLLSRAEEAAISCFAHNLRHLFWREGVVAETVVALDPGFSACKAALLTSTGSLHLEVFARFVIFLAVRAGELLPTTAT